MAPLSGASQVATGREGTGAAFLLPGSNITPLDVVIDQTEKLRYRQRVDEANRLKAEKDERDRMLAGLKETDVNTAGAWDRHLGELGKAKKGVRDLWASYYQKGIDPRDPALHPTEYAQANQAIDALSTGVQLSTQAKENYNKAYQTLIANPDDYDVAKSTSQMDKFRNLPLTDLAKWDEPLLVPKAPDLGDLNAEFNKDFFGKPDVKTNIGIGGEYVTDEKITYFEPERVKKQSLLAFENIINKGGGDQLETMFEALPENEKTTIEAQAELEGRDPLEYFNYTKYMSKDVYEQRDKNIKNANDSGEAEKEVKNQTQFYLDQWAEMATNPDFFSEKGAGGNMMNTEFLNSAIMGKYEYEDYFANKKEANKRILSWERTKEGKIMLKLSDGSKKEINPDDPAFLNQFFRFNTTGVSHTKLSDAMQATLKKAGALREDGTADWLKYKEWRSGGAKPILDPDEQKEGELD